MIKSIFLFINTVKHLRIIQIYYRIKKYIKRQNKVNFNSLARSKNNVDWIVQNNKKPSIINKNIFYFLNKKSDFKVNGWNNKNYDKLWNYNQHYFDDLNAFDSKKKIELHQGILKDWVKSNPPFSGVGWEPYPTSLRVVNWIKWSYTYNQISQDLINILAIQARFIFSNIEFHILGNHLFCNAKALIFAGYYFCGDEAKKWLQKGLKILEIQMKEQIMSDGGHFERSPMYHNLILEDVLDLINLLRNDKKFKSEVRLWKLISNKMILWMDGLTHQDGEISFFNDSASGIALKASHIKKYAKSLQIKIKDLSIKNKFSNLYYQHFIETGYIRLISKNATAILDVAQLGPDYLPGHGHADTLSFELSLHDQRIIVNAGTSGYEETNNRLWERSTKAHSTVEIDNKNSSEVWKSFRVGKRALPFNINIKENVKEIEVSCSHDGYLRLPGKNIHQRYWLWRQNSLIVKDIIKGNYRCALARYLLHPMIGIKKGKVNNEYILKLPKNNIVILEVINGKSNLGKSKYAFEFGKQVSTNILLINPVNNMINIKISW